MKPYEAKGELVCDLQTDHHDIGDFWILTDGYRVSVNQQKVGESPTQKIIVPRATFNLIVDWYMRDQAKRKTKAALLPRDQPAPRTNLPPLANKSN